MKKIIFAIETSCDETAFSLVEAHGNLSAPKFKVVKSVIASQIPIHRPFGGVVPNLAKREHIKNLPILARKIFSEGQNANRLWKKIDLIAVTVGPGLEPALWAGITFAKELQKKLFAISHRPIALVGANHLEGHLFSFLLSKKKKAEDTKHQTPNTRHLFPAIALVVSGGHTILLKMESLTKTKKIGETRDDAAGEAFDKVARLLGLPYPGGPEIQKLAARGKRDAIPFPRPMLYHPSTGSTGSPQAGSGQRKSYDFSFSGLKTAVLYYLRDNPKANKADVAASAQEAIIDVLAQKTIRAAKEFRAKAIFLSGGVAANKALRERLKKETRKLKLAFLVPDFEYNTDNASMIAVAAYINFLKGKKYKLTARGDMNL